MALNFEKKPKRDTAVTIRLKNDTVKMLKALADKYDVSQADIIEKLIEIEFEKLDSKKSKVVKL